MYSERIPRRLAWLSEKQYELAVILRSVPSDEGSCFKERELSEILRPDFIGTQNDNSQTAGLSSGEA
jgi:hypothetical protein